MVVERLDFSQDFGFLLNKIQNIVLEDFSKEEINDYVIKSSRDAEQTEDLDGILLNGHYFDWREFDTRKREIVSAYLEYFTDEQLERIDLALGGKA